VRYGAFFFSSLPLAGSGGVEKKKNPPHMLRARQMMAALRVITLIHHGDVHIYTAINNLSSLIVENPETITRRNPPPHPWLPMSTLLPMQTKDRCDMCTFCQPSFSRLEKASLILGVSLSRK
jgi:hypothetical protein